MAELCNIYKQKIFTMTNKILTLLALILTIGMTSCGDDNDNGTLTLDLNGLTNLGDGYAYEGWIMVDGAPKTTGIFTVNDAGELSSTSFDIATEDLDAATAFILTIEPSPDSDPAPSDVHIVAGDFAGDAASVTVGHGAALGDDFTSSAGGFILATPTDSDDTNEDAGVWFLDNSSGAPAVGLDLPTLPAGWAYEGWAVINDTPVSTGTFTDVAAADNASLYSTGGPAYPGEDFLTNAPAGLSFPADLHGSTIVISVEPVPDNSPAPFVLKPLVKQVGADAQVHNYITLNNNATATNPTGTVTK